MNEMELVAAVSQMVVTEPVRIPIAEFVRAYDEHRSVERQSPKFAALAGMFGSRLAAFVPAIQHARADCFFQPTRRSCRASIAPGAYGTRHSVALGCRPIGNGNRNLFRLRKSPL